MIKTYTVHSIKGTETTIRLEFEPIIDSINDNEIENDAKIVYDILSEYLPAQTYLELRDLT